MMGAALCLTCTLPKSFENSDSLKAVRSTIHSSQSSTSQSTTDRLRKAVDENARLLKMLEETRAALSSSKHESDQQRTKDTETIKRLSTELQDTRAQLRDLAADVDLARARISDLRSERAAGEMLGQSSTQPSQEPFEQERAAWTAARTQLEVELAAAKERITSVEKDVALFREQHGIVTAFADGATDELIALRESEALARSRADDGVAMVRGMFENRIRAIEQELEEQKRLNKILTEKDERTNDAVRREAAEAVQLREERNRWKERASRAEREEARLQELVESLEDGSYHGSDTEQLPPLKVAEKVEIFLHHNGSTEAELALDGIPELPDPNASQQNGTNQRTDSTSDHDEEEVFMCLIRDGSAKTACNALFGTQSVSCSCQKARCNIPQVLTLHSQHLGAHVLKEHLTT